MWSPRLQVPGDGQNQELDRIRQTPGTALGC